MDWTAFSKGAEQNKYQVAAESADGFVPASVLWTTSVGSGRVLVDQLLWGTATPLPAQTTLAAGIAAGLGIAFTAGSGAGLLPTTGWVGFASPNNGAAASGYDRDDSTRWSSDALQAPGMYYGLDLGAVHTIGHIVVGRLARDRRRAGGPADPDLLRRRPPTTTVAQHPEHRQPDRRTGVLTIPLDPPLATRYLKMIDTGTAGTYMSLYELYLFGQ